MTSQQGENHGRTAPITVRLITYEFLKIGCAAILLVGLAWCTPILVRPFANYGFTHGDFVAIAAVSILFLGIACCTDYIRKAGTFRGGWRQVCTTVVRVYLLVLVLFVALRYFAQP